MPIASAPASRSSCRAARSDGRGRLALHLDRQARHRRPDRPHAAGEVSGAAVASVARPGGQHHLPHAVEADRGLGDLGELLGRLHRGRGAGAQRLLDRAEPAAVLLAVAHAGLDDRRREHVVAVQAGDLLVGHAVGGREVVERGAGDGGDLDAQVGDPAVGAGAHEAPVAQPVGARRVDRDRGLQAVDEHVAVGGRTGAAGAAQGDRRPEVGGGRRAGERVGEVERHTADGHFGTGGQAQIGLRGRHRRTSRALDSGCHGRGAGTGVPPPHRAVRVRAGRSS